MDQALFFVENLCPVILIIILTCKACNEERLAFSNSSLRQPSTLRQERKKTQCTLYGKTLFLYMRSKRLGFRPEPASENHCVRFCKQAQGAALATRSRNILGAWVFPEAGFFKFHWYHRGRSIQQPLLTRNSMKVERQRSRFKTANDEFEPFPKGR